MRDLLVKEFRLSASVLAYLFLPFGLMFLLPGYPILCGAFFVTLGIFQSFQKAREENDVLFSSLLPVSKRDVVKARYLFVCLLELCGFLLAVAATGLRMTVLADLAAYRNNALMNANGFALGMALFLFGLFNVVFVGGFFKTAYKIGVPFAVYLVLAMLSIGVAETLHHFPILSALNAFGTDRLLLQLLLLAGGAAAYALMTFLSCSVACRRFEKIDL